MPLHETIPVHNKIAPVIIRGDCMNLFQRALGPDDFVVVNAPPLKTSTVTQWLHIFYKVQLVLLSAALRRLVRGQLSLRRRAILASSSMEGIVPRKVQKAYVPAHQLENVTWTRGKPLKHAQSKVPALLAPTHCPHDSI